MTFPEPIDVRPDKDRARSPFDASWLVEVEELGFFPVISVGSEERAIVMLFVETISVPPEEMTPELWLTWFTRAVAVGGFLFGGVAPSAAVSKEAVISWRVLDRQIQPEVLMTSEAGRRQSPVVRDVCLAIEAAISQIIAAAVPKASPEVQARLEAYHRISRTPRRHVRGGRRGGRR